MIMYHGTSESSARAIESGGFCVSEDGMLGKGVYCSRHRQGQGLRIVRRKLARQRRIRANNPL
jgi:hypothetical protein